MIKIRNLTKDYGKTRALQGINLDIRKNETFGILGPNGAGKTTIVSVLSTMLKPTDGTVWINGFNIKNESKKIREIIGIVFQEPSLDKDLTAYDNLYFHCRLYNVKNMDVKIDKLLKLVDLQEKKDMLVDKFSGGMKRRLEIIRGILHEPKILFLDEPTRGLDPQTRHKILNYIKELKNITVILTTHYMEEADQLCDRVAIIDNGKVVAIDTPKNLKKKIGDDIIELKTSNQKIKTVLGNKNFIKKIVQNKGGIYQVTVSDGESKIPRILELTTKNKIKIISISLRKPTLDDVFLYCTGKTIREKELDYEDRIKLRMKRKK